MYYLGIDLGGTNIAAGVVDESCKIIARAERKTVVPCKPEGLVDDLAATALEALSSAGLTLKNIPWVGIGCPGTVNRDTGVVEFSNNLYLHHFHLKELLEKKLGAEVVIENDANAAAYGEYHAGALKGAKNGIAITLGTGVGGGIIIDGKIYSGSNFAGGELGHTVIVHNGRPCNCGRKGCWEAYASATGLIVSTKEHMLEQPGDKTSPLWALSNGDINQVTGRTAFDAMRAGDPLAKEIADSYIAQLVCGLANCINIFQPDILCIGGGISNERDNLLNPVRALLKTQVYSIHSTKQTQICRAALGNDAGIIGAALLGK